ncbi:MAG: hypothetical protein HYY30_13170 [Chloroflexi bacterium]|nr:hypothetical protein [Chloroflexota bacterium]
MNPLGLAMAFVFLWAAVGLGVFLLTTAAVRLTKRDIPAGAVAQAVVVSQTRARFDTIINVVLLLAGVALTYFGGNGIYTVIYR